MRVAHQDSGREERRGERGRERGGGERERGRERERERGRRESGGGGRDQIVAYYYTEHLLTGSQHFPMRV